MHVYYDKESLELPVDVIYRQIGIPLIWSSDPHDYVALLSDKMLYRTYRASWDIMKWVMRLNHDPLGKSCVTPTFRRLLQIPGHPMLMWVNSNHDNIQWMAELFQLTVREAKYRGNLFPTDDALASHLSIFHHIPGPVSLEFFELYRHPKVPPVLVPPEYRYSEHTKEWARCANAYKYFYLWEFCNGSEGWTARTPPKWVDHWFLTIKDATA